MYIFELKNDKLNNFIREIFSITISLGYFVYVFFASFKYHSKLGLIYVILASLFWSMSDWLNVIFHELGHLILGSLVGLKVYAISFFHFSFFRMSSGWICVRSKTGKIGQCLMCPKENQKNRKIGLYICGGWLFTAIIVTFVSILCILLRNNSKFIYMLAMVSFIFQGVKSIIYNIVPSDENGLANDAYNMALIKKDKEQEKALYYQLSMDKCLLQGLRYREMTEQELFLVETENIEKTGLIFYTQYILYMYYLDSSHFDGVLRMMKNFEKNYIQYPKYIQNTIDIERLYIACIFNKEDYEAQYKTVMEKQEEYIKNLSYFRSLAAYYSTVKNTEELTKVYNYLVRNVNMNLYKGCNECELELVKSLIQT